MVGKGMSNHSPNFLDDSTRFKMPLQLKTSKHHSYEKVKKLFTNLKIRSCKYCDIFFRRLH